MNYIKKANESKHTIVAMSAVFFIIMLICNFLIPLIADDFGYSYSHFDDTRLTSIPAIIKSTYYHYFLINGRNISHFFAQIFLMYPLPIFKVVNAAMFILQVYLIYRLARRDHKENTLLFCMVFGSIWIFQPAFGQINLWLVGACNYLWCAVFNLLFLLPFITKLLVGKDIQSRLGQIGFVLFSLLAGGYGENASLATLIMTVLLMCGSTFYWHTKPKGYQVAALGAFIIGFVIIMMSPGELKTHISQRTFSDFFKSFIFALSILYQMKMLIAALVVLFTLACLTNVRAEKLFLSGTFVIGALCAHFAVCFGSYYAERSAFFTAILLISACAVLFTEIMDSQYCNMAICLGTLTLCFSLYFGLVGMQDIYETHLYGKRTESIIMEHKANGVLDIVVPLPRPSTKYSPLWYLTYLETQSSDGWPNNFMAKYYGVNSLIGTWD